MSEEEKEAITTLKDIKEKRFYTHAFDNGTLVLDDDEIECVETILNLIKKQQEQLQEKDKIINIMGEQLAGLTIFSNDIESPLMLGAKSEVIEYFTKKAREV